MPGEMEESSAGLINCASAAPEPTPGGLGLVIEKTRLWLELVCWAQITVASPALSQDGLGASGVPSTKSLRPCLA